jgi:hypothetical protein
LKKNPNERLSLESVMKHHWILKYAKLDLNITNQNLTLNSSLGNFGANATNSSQCSSNSTSSTNANYSKPASNGMQTTTVTASATTTINNNTKPNTNSIMTQYSIKKESSNYYQK